MKILGIETSCDETAASVVEMRKDGSFELLSNTVASSMDLHVRYGGVVPEVAARSHIEHMMPVIEKALSEAFSERELRAASHKANLHLDAQSSDDFWSSVDAIAVTEGPGLGGSLLVGIVTARTLALRKNKPLYAVNHVMAHPFAAFITAGLTGFTYPKKAPQFPMLALIVSGGHSQLVLFTSPLEYTLLGKTRDDAVGEAFDKVAKILGLPYPGGPSISKKALEGNPKAYQLPRAKLNNKYDFSFSGLKTAVLRTAQAEIGEDYSFPSTQLAERLSEAQKADIAASFQHNAIETLVDKTVQAYKEFSPASVVVAGGVAANTELRRQMAEKLPLTPIYPDIKLCTDNGAMVAALGCFIKQQDIPPADPYTLDISPSLSM